METINYILKEAKKIIITIILIKVKITQILKEFINSLIILIWVDPK
jgi:hypothetical protein